jgi:arylsulfatase A-like enzyme
MKYPFRFSTLVIVSVFSLCVDAVAHPGHSHSDNDRDKSKASSTASPAKHQRTWTVSTNGRQVDASILLSKGGQLRLERSDGSVVTIPLQDLADSDRLWAQRRLHEIRLLNTQPGTELLALQTGRRERESAKPLIASLFDPFRKHVQVRWDNDFLYVESDGMPDHPMMIGITAWQQQVPLPQQYTGNNAWRIPLNPVPASKPMSAKTGFFRGAIAIAVNGVPIFNPIKNDGKTDTLAAGELDQWGGHCGRADDYHYHIAPVHLDRIVGKGKPVGFALDGYPIYGYADEDGSTPKDLDWLNGHKDEDGDYHYHATKTYPYLNGGFYGEVVERDGQVDPQPRARGVRPSLTGLRGAKITGFENPKPNSFKVEYDVSGDKRSVSYDVADNGSAVFRFTDSNGTRTEEYHSREGGGRGGPGGRQDGQAGRPEDKGRPRPEGQPRENRSPQGEERRPPGGGGDPLMRALDTNRDGTIDGAELSRAAEVLKSLDTNGDGRLTSDELRGGGRQGQSGGQRGQGGGGPNRPDGERAGAGQPQGRTGGPRGPQPGDGPRQPWILVHAEEVDLNEDGIISRDEIVGEAEKAFGGYDANKDGELSESELNGKGNVRSAMGGFIRGHAKELDRDNDGVLTRKESIDNATRMFARIDENEDGKITKIELEASRRTGDGAEGQQQKRGGPAGGDDEGQGSDQRKGERRGQRKGQGGGQKRRGGPDADKPQRDQASADSNSTAVESRPMPARPTTRTPRTGSQPNFVFILIDDMGWQDMGFSGNDFAETPNTDQIAREGIIFSQAYSSAPNCAPSRACIMSGQYPPRHGIYTVVDERHAPGSPHHKVIAAHSKDTMDTEVITIAECLRDAGYATAAYGMWNLGRGRSGPNTATGQGFDVYEKPQDIGFDQHSYFDEDGNFLTDVFTDHGIDFIESNKDRPFFLYLPFHAIHAPFEPKPDLVAKYERKAQETGSRTADSVYAAMVDAVDQNIGRVMDSLKRLNLDDNTMVVFTSDNGGTPEFVAPLNGSKGALYEGGIRVPACVWWSGINNPGRTSDTPILGMDFYPTMLAAAGIALPKQTLDGANFLPVLQNTGEVDRDAVFWHFPSYVGRGAPSSAIRIGEWKLIEHFEDHRLELFNLTKDIGESRNLAGSNPTKAKELHARLTAWQQSTSADIPTALNPNFDPSAVRSRGNGGGQKRGGQRRGGQKNQER